MRKQDKPSNQTQSDWQLQDQLFDELLALQPEQRIRRLSELHQESPKLAKKLTRLLESAEDDHATVLLSDSTIGLAAFDSMGHQQIPSRIGAWDIIRPIGEGGMARVFEASRSASDGKQRAAIKILSRGINSEWAEQNFQREIGILARLEDPRLSRLIDWGITEQHTPWLAMELVEGQHIDQACDQRKISLQSRIEIMLEVIRAITHAHQQLIVHGDIKPSNVLLDDSDHVRVLDFGISRLSNSNPEKQIESAQAYTLNYASPEQLLNEPIGPASDIFQLGLLLYRLLTGDTPFQHPSGKKEKRLQAIHDWSDTNSRWLSNISQEAALARKTTVTKLSRRIRGDLEAIVRKALAAEPTQRYSSAESMADDLQRWLDKRPVHARGFRLRDRVRCFLRRNSVGTSAAVILLGLVSILIISTIQHNRQLTIERDVAQAAQVRSEAMHDFMLDTFGTVDPNLQETRGMSVDELLVQSVERVRNQFSNDPETAAMLLFDFAGLLERRSRYDDAIDAYQEAYAIFSEQFGPGHPNTLEILSPGLVGALLSAGQFDDAHQLLDQARQHLPSIREFIEPVHVEIWLSTATAHSRVGNYEQGVEATQQANSMLQDLRSLMPANSDMLDRLDEMQTHIDHQLGALFAQAGDWGAAEPLLRVSLERFEAQFGIEDNRSQIVRMNWAASLRELGHYEQAQQELERLLQAQQKLHQGPHMSKAYTLGHLANLSSKLQDYQAAITLWQAVEDETRKATDADHPFIQRARMAQGRDLLRDGQCVAGRAVLEAVIARTDLPANTVERAITALEEISCPATYD